VCSSYSGAWQVQVLDEAMRTTPTEALHCTLPAGEHHHDSVLLAQHRAVRRTGHCGQRDAAFSTAAGKVINLQIGCHTDGLWNKNLWSRLPVVVRKYQATSVITSIGSALGGLIYIILPAGLSMGMQSVTISGGATLLADWDAAMA
jgi:hypothetical protein